MYSSGVPNERLQNPGPPKVKGPSLLASRFLAPRVRIPETDDAVHTYISSGLYVLALYFTVLEYVTLVESTTDSWAAISLLRVSIVLSWRPLQRV